MSFDIYFVRRPANDDWDAAIDAREAAAEIESVLSDDRLAQWEGIKTAVRRELPDAEESVGQDSREIDDESTGVQLTMFESELTLSVPYWSEGAEAERVVDLLRRVTAQIEAITGLVGYDPQSDCAFLEGQPRQAVDTFDHVRVVLDDDAAPTKPRVPEIVKRRWWPFGRH